MDLRLLLSFSFLLIFLCPSIALSVRDTIKSDQFIKVKAQRGDGIYALLRRYELDKHSCNFKKFYELNQLKRNAALYQGRIYQLPVMIYKFNGKTIRSTIGINDWDLAISIQRYNERMLEAQVRGKAFQNDKELWVPFHKINCPDADLSIPEPEQLGDMGEAELADKENSRSSGRRKFDIFGSRYAYTPLESNKLKGKIYYIVSGHGGPDPGATGRKSGRKLCEDEYAYDVALRLCRNLVANGATAYMINRDANDGIRSAEFLSCDEDEVLWGDIKMVTAHRARLFQRSHVINTLYEKNKKKGVADQKLICIHVDSRTKGTQIDLFFYYHPEDNQGKSLARVMQKTMKEKYSRYRNYKGTIFARDLHMLRETEVPGVYIELGNIRNSMDQQRILLESNRQALANWLYDGLLRAK